MKNGHLNSVNGLFLGRMSLKMCVVYHIPYSKNHPVTDATFIEEIQDYFESVVLCKEKLLIAGDFNLHVNDESDSYANEFLDILVSFGLVNHVSVPTHESGNTLDLLITRNNNELVLSTPKAGYHISDHCFVSTRLDIPRPDLQLKTISFRQVKEMDMSEFRSDLMDICNDLLGIDDIDRLAKDYNSKLLQCLDKHAPIITKSFVVRPKVPYFDSSLRDMKKSRRKAESLWRRDRNNMDLRSEFKKSRNKFVGTLDSAKTSHYSDAISEASGDQKKLYSIIQSLSSGTRDNPLPTHESIQQLADDFGDYFVTKIEKIRLEIDAQNAHPPDLPSSPSCNTLSTFRTLSETEVRALVMESKTTSCALDPIPTSLLKQCIDCVLPILTKMVNMSLQTGVFPEEWKLALVIPLIKKFGLEEIFKNYRPVSNLPFVGKLTERAVIKQDTTHMENNCPLPDNSSAYRQGHSTETALVKVHADILKNMERQQVTLLVLIDLSAAFDTVDHNIAIKVLNSKYGISGLALEWHRSYLSGRMQCVNINGTHSKISKLAYGVPQGSCLGPVLFTQYASSLFDVIYKHLDHGHGYADDHQLYLPFSPNSVSSQHTHNFDQEILV